MKPTPEEALLAEALERPVHERAVFLDGACRGDKALRERLETLLAAHEQPQTVLATQGEAARLREDAPARQVRPLEPRRDELHESRADIQGLAELGPPMDEAVGQTLGRYKLLEKIGEGGCGVVYVAEQTEPVHRRVALKVIKLGMDTKQVVARFEAERQALAMMDHPNIAKVLDAGTTGPADPGSSGRESAETSASENQSRLTSAATIGVGRPYFVMELVRGIRITDYCDQAKLSTKERLDLFIKVCQAIQHAHQKGIIHRDIKPSNILVTLHDGVPVPKVIDFGIAKATEGRLTDNTVYTQLHQFIGTPAYMSPEQAEMSGLDIDTRSDIYSLGVLLYELLVGSTPFDAKELMASGIDQMRKTIREKEPPRPSTKLSQTLVAAETVGRVAPRAPSSGEGGSNGGAHGVTRPTLKSEEEVRADSRRLLRVKETIALLRGDLDWIVMKCLEKDRQRRYETANGLAADLKRHLNNEPVVARPPTAAYKFQKAFRRNKLVFAAGAAVAVALLLGVVASTWQATVARRAEAARAEEARIAKRERDNANDAQAQAQTAQKLAETEQQRADAQARKATESQQQSRRLLYAADMSLAQQSLKQNNLGRARRLLDRHRPQPGEEDLRGWEWRYLWQLTRSSALVTLTNRPVRGFCVSFSPDGTRLAAGWYDGRVDLWDVPGRRWVRALTERAYPHAGRVAFSPVRNLLAATSEPKVVALYDLDSGRESILWRAPDQVESEVRDLTFSQDGSRLVIYAGTPRGTRSTPGPRDEVTVVNVSNAQIESRHSTVLSISPHFGAALLSPDNRLLYLARSDFLNYRYGIQCLDLATGQELWQTKSQRDLGLATLAISPDGRVLASGSGFEDCAVHVWDSATGQLLLRLDGHTGWLCKLAFSKDGRRLISAASDQSIRFWDTSTWAETQVLRGHADEIHAVAISESAQLIASASKDGDLMLWQDDGRSAADGYRRLPEDLRVNEVLPLDHSRVMLLPSDQPPEVLDLKRDSPPVPLPEIESSTKVLGWFGTNILCQWNGTNQILVREWRGAEFVQRGAIALDSGMRPSGVAYNATRQLLAWASGTNSASVYLASLAAPGRRIELKSDVSGLVPFRFSEDGNYLAAVTKGSDYLAAVTKGADYLCAWKIETGQNVVSIRERVRDATFAAGSRVLVVAIEPGTDHEIVFYDLDHPDWPPRRVSGKHSASALAVSPDGGLVASSVRSALVKLFDPAKAELTGSPLHGHLASVFGIAFSPDGRRLISASGAREAVKLWDVGTRQELLTLSGTGSLLDAARWSADGDLILAGPPWQAWRAPSWEEIDAAEAKVENSKLKIQN